MSDNLDNAMRVMSDQARQIERLRAALVAAMEVVKAERERITQYDFVEPKREPLSDEEVLILLRSLAPDVTANLRGYIAIVRAVERHYGIGGSDE